MKKLLQLILLIFFNILNGCTPRTNSWVPPETIKRSCDLEPIKKLECQYCFHCGNEYENYIDPNRKECIQKNPNIECILNQVVFMRSWSIDGDSCGFEYTARLENKQLVQVSCDEFFKRLKKYQLECNNCLILKTGSVD